MATKVHLRWLRIGIWARMDNNLIEVKVRWKGDTMFDGKNNRLLDSMYFRLLLTTGGFLVWFGASYLLLSLS